MNFEKMALWIINGIPGEPNIRFLQFYDGEEIDIQCTQILTFTLSFGTGFFPNLEPYPNWK